MRFGERQAGVWWVVVVWWSVSEMGSRRQRTDGEGRRRGGGGVLGRLGFWGSGSLSVCVVAAAAATGSKSPDALCKKERLCGHSLLQAARTGALFCLRRSPVVSVLLPPDGMRVPCDDSGGWVSRGGSSLAGRGRRTAHCPLQRGQHNSLLVQPASQPAGLGSIGRRERGRVPVCAGGWGFGGPREGWRVCVGRLYQQLLVEPDVLLGGGHIRPLVRAQTKPAVLTDKVRLSATLQGSP